jgi:biopolymer transport protein ExbD
MASADAGDDEITGINVTPLVDVTLVLLVVFMVTASYIVAPAIKVELPKASTSEATPQSTLSLVLTREGTLYLNNAPVQPEDVRAFVRAQRARGAELQAVLAADAAVPHGRVVAVIDLIKSEGVTGFALNTDADFSSGARP